MKNIAMVAVTALFLGTGCGAKEVKRINPNDVEGVNTKWSRTDIQETVELMVNSMLESQAEDLRGKPVIIIDPVANETTEYIDTQNVTDLVRNKLLGKGFTFTVTKKERRGVVDEIEEQDESGVFEKEELPPGEKPGLTAPKFTLKGRVSSIEKRNSDVKDVYYQLTLQLYKIRKGVIVWSDTKKIAKQQDR
ncbi:MAG: penicillin-binding protein activator LpoB [Planctomycetota bacterium]|nr:penicillin-binding protein activator LpoB [Planctomycetota bacterium]